MNDTCSLDVMHRCRGPAELRRWAQQHLGIDVPAARICPHHQAPLDYLWAAYHEPATDIVVWAPRGGGKTRLGAAATLLDLLHKTPCNVRILGGSLDQSLRMWEHLQPDLLRLMEHAVVGRPRARRVDLEGGSSCAVLTQSQRAVRGLRVQKLRCDEVELFDPRIWQAAQLTTRSARRSSAPEDERDPAPVRGTIEALSTLHEPAGLMQGIIDAAAASGTPVIRWCLLEVLERCPADRDCRACDLHPDCNGIAKTRCEGFVGIEDALAQKRRVSREVWESEMLCIRPVRRNSVFPDFDPAIHVRDDAAAAGAEVTLAIDFGYHAPFVCLWVARHGDGRVCVVDEYVQSARTIDRHIAEIDSRPWGRPRRIACDPAGGAPNEQTARSNTDVLKAAGFSVYTRSSRIQDGLEMIRAALAPAAGPVRLFVHPRCGRLIRAFTCYRYPDGASELPDKDGEHDHLIDALRYFYVNQGKGGTRAGRY